MEKPAGARAPAGFFLRPGPRRFIGGLSLALLLLAACGDGGGDGDGEPTGPTPTAQAPEATPAEPQPTVAGVRSAPPPAWIQTSEGAVWLAFFDYCWEATCIDSRPVDQRTDVPTVEVGTGEQVRVHLAFEPEEAELVVDSVPQEVTAGKTIVWTASGSGGLFHLTVHRERQRAEYVAELRVS